MMEPIGRLARSNVSAMAAAIREGVRAVMAEAAAVLVEDAAAINRRNVGAEHWSDACPRRELPPVRPDVHVV